MVSVGEWAGWSLGVLILAKEAGFTVYAVDLKFNGVLIC